MSQTLDQQKQDPGKLTLKIGARGVVMKYVQGYPTVQLKNGQLLKPEKWFIKTAGGHVVARAQLLLKLSWAFSIHKSQGLTLDDVEMSPFKAFEAGQAYVAPKAWKVFLCCTLTRSRCGLSRRC